MNKLEVGMYVRFENVINKIIEIDEEYVVFDMNWYDHWGNEISAMKYDLFIKEYKPESDENILNLIEKGDVVGLKNEYCAGKIYKVVGTYIDAIGLDAMTDGIMYVDDPNDIEFVVSRKQFENVKYKLV